ncbi:UDP-N-acetylglucosamine 2-epimerase (non-hydrolyzing) [Parabacteroides sp. 52]|uniref:non-hydrolyzing UDP-N-acetylglucosamine 2-epimerase n=1 Tax=unclassified Parabacteroides TaxID=2649774 RepID=UPI0013D12687|nr:MULTISPECIES: UDP-N-acetylglucosamine 2-epimerase (non-hydrolyzing) [unclassified Parabacteroides]MDH6533902.1 UDP-GlcNAc3NAcA epimerase [Parabacteroides sp. PM5-20]NDV54647.1 UDP-N-acetylglucosamine 2-epimerase (non-hydrolyzing) [Parabacteroides sp. 52]
MKIVTIVGARPQFIKAAMVSRAILEHNRKKPELLIEEFLLHTGQHYDENMSSIFFTEMGIPQPTWHLQCGNGSHGEMTGSMLIEIEKILLDTLPDYVLVYGDTNSTLAGALAASKLNIPVIHVEAGLRSFNRQMPEEVNRVLTDHLSTLLCCPTFAAVNHLTEEGIHKGVYHVGDVMYDAALVFGRLADTSSDILNQLAIKSKSFYLCTVHRAENTDNKERLYQIFTALKEIGSPSLPVVLPLHPRTQTYLEKYGWMASLREEPGIILTPPLSFLDMVLLEKQALTILTDSGGIQKEAYFHQTPCITLREETEWKETVDAGWNQIAGYQATDILRCLHKETNKKEILEYGNGDAAGEIIKLL